MTRPPVLVTGGAGFVGSHTVRVLAREGYHPVVVDDLSAGHRTAVVAGDFFEGDLADSGLLEDLFQRYPFHAVMHFAGRAYVGESIQDPLLYYRENVVKTWPLLKLVCKHRPRFVFSSSCTVYGVPPENPITEESPRRPVNPYGQTKRFLEETLENLRRSDGLQFVALRYFNAAGASQDGVLGESHDPETHLIPRVLRAVLRKDPPVVVFGTDYPTQDGTCVRDYVHVEDLATAHLSALRWLECEERSEVFNLGTGRGWSVRQIIEAAAEVCAHPVPVEYGPRRAGDPPELVADPSRAAQVLGWRARRSDLKVILRDAWRWQANPRY